MIGLVNVTRILHFSFDFLVDTAGNGLIFSYIIRNASAFTDSVTDNGGNTWLQAAGAYTGLLHSDTYFPPILSTFYYGNVFYCPAVEKAGVITIGIDSSNFGGTTQISALIYQVSGGIAFDQANVLGGNPTKCTSFLIGPTMTASVESELYVSLAAQNYYLGGGETPFADPYVLTVNSPWILNDYQSGDIGPQAYFIGTGDQSTTFAFVVQPCRDGLTTTAQYAVSTTLFKGVISGKPIGNPYQSFC